MAVYTKKRLLHGIVSESFDLSLNLDNGGINALNSGINAVDGGY